MNRLFGIFVAVCVLCAFTIDAQAKVGINAGIGLSRAGGADGEAFFNVNMSKRYSGI